MPQKRTEVAKLLQRRYEDGDVTRAFCKTRVLGYRGIDTGLLFTTANNTVRTSGSGERSAATRPLAQDDSNWCLQKTTTHRVRARGVAASDRRGDALTNVRPRPRCNGHAS